MRTIRLKALSAWLGLSLALTAGAWADSRTEATSPQSLNRAVYHQLVMLPQLTIFDDLSFTVNGRDLTLFGEVRNAVLKDEAASAVKHLAGVNHVDNEIQILPPSFNDDHIRREMVRALFRNSQLFRYSLGAVPSIHIIVNNGHVTLRGLVVNQGDKNVAGIRANGVPGVFSVDNELQVEKD